MTDEEFGKTTTKTLNLPAADTKRIAEPLSDETIKTVDGNAAIIQKPQSAPYESQEMQRFPEARNANLPPSEFLPSPTPAGNAMPPTRLNQQPPTYKPQIEDTQKALNPKQKPSKWVSFTKMVVRGAIIGTGAGAIIGLILEVTGYEDGVKFGVLTFVYAIFGLLLLGLVIPILKLLIDYGWKD